VHEICTNQVVITLHACVKELIENSLDAGATRLELRLRENGSELLELVDNGHGISAEDYEKLAMRHATSKIGKYEDLSQTLSTFGFRGEALCAICAMGDVSVCTRTASDPTATLLVYDKFGKLTSKATAAREVGTTVSVKELFKRLPVRHREFLRNAKAQVSATLRLIQAYAVAQPEIRFHVSAEKARGTGTSRQTLLSTSGTSQGWRQAVASVLGDNLLVDVQAFDLEDSKSGWTVSGLVSTPFGGRRTRDTQLFFINNRPVEPPKRIVKLLNDTFHQYNSRMYPLLILSFTASQTQVDVNVTPDKRTVFLHKEEQLMEDLQQRLTDLYSVGTGGTASGGSLTTQKPSQPEVEHAATKQGSQSSVAPPLPLTNVEGALRNEQRDAPFATQLSMMDFVGGTQDTGRGDDAALPPPEPLMAMEIDLDADDSPGFQTQPSAVVRETSGSEHPSIAGLVVEAWEPGDSPPLEEARTGGVHTPAPAIYEKAAEHRLSFTPEKVPLRPLAGVDTEGDPSLQQDFQIVELEIPSLEARSQGANAGGVEEDSLQDTPPEPGVAEPQPRRMAPLDQALGTKTSVKLTLADLEAAVERRSKRARNHKTGGAPLGNGEKPRVQFPSAFSLSSLNGKGGSSSLEEVAKFGTSLEAEAYRDSATSPLQFDKKYFSQMRVIGQFNLGFILAALRGGQGGSLQLFIIDQHASDEKFRFEGLNRDSKVDKQPLVNPHYLQLTPAQEQLATSNLEVFRMNGFELSLDESRPPGRRLRLASLPSCKGLVFDEKDILDLLWKLEQTETDGARPSQLDASARGSSSSGGEGLLDLTAHRALWSATSVPRPPKVWCMLAMRACRGAIMIGRALKEGEMERVLTNLGTLHQPWNCPHGRPTMRHLVDASAAKRTGKRPPPLAKLLSRGGSL